MPQSKVINEKKKHTNIHKLFYSVPLSSNAHFSFERLNQSFVIKVKSNLYSLVLYITVWGGILSQVVLGALQLFCFLVVCTNFQKLTKPLKTHLVVYGMLATISLLLMAIDFKTFLIVFWPFSGILAFYFLFITYQLKKLPL